jgi:hypothetical protein
MRRIAFATFVAVVCGCGSDSERSQQDTGACARLRDHVVDLRVAGLRDDREAHRQALHQALGERFVARHRRAFARPGTWPKGLGHSPGGSEMMLQAE